MTKTLSEHQKEVRKKLKEVYYRDFTNFNQIDCVYDDVESFLDKQLALTWEAALKAVEDEGEKLPTGSHCREAVSEIIAKLRK